MLGEVRLSDFGCLTKSDDGTSWTIFNSQQNRTVAILQHGLSSEEFGYWH